MIIIWFWLQGKTMIENSSLSTNNIIDASYPLEIVQIDYTKLHVKLVDDTSREAIGQPWLILAVDSYSKIITGYALSFDSPDETSLSKCLLQSISPKEGIAANWNVSGLMKILQVDNDVKFASKQFKETCLTHGIQFEIHKQTPTKGGIERIFGLIDKEIQRLTDVTLSVTEFESFLVKFICSTYHEQILPNLGMSPLQKWNAGISENNAIQH